MACLVTQAKWLAQLATHPREVNRFTAATLASRTDSSTAG